MTERPVDAPVLIAGGGPVGMTLAIALAAQGVNSILVERNETTTRHPKMDLTNGRSMELFRLLGIVDRARAVGVPEDQTLDITYATSATGYRLHTFDYGTPTDYRRRCRELNDGTMTLEPPMRVSQQVLEPVLKESIDENPLIDVRFGWAFESFEQDGQGVTSVIRHRAGETNILRTSYLAGCDGGGSRVREAAGIGLEGDFGIVPIYMVHFRSTDHGVLAKFGAAYHLQTGFGTLIAQNGRDIWTLHVVLSPDTDVSSIDPAELVRKFAGCDFEFNILVANHWTPHVVIADTYRSNRVLLAGDAAHQFIPTGGYGMNTGIGDAVDLGWKLAAVIQGWGGEGLLDSLEERRKIAIQNKAAALSNMTDRFTIEQYIQQQRTECDVEAEDAESVRQQIAAEIQRIGNAENESWGIEFGYRYIGSDIIVYDADESEAPVFDRLNATPTSWPGARLPHFFLTDGSALYDQLAYGFTLLCLKPCDVAAMSGAAEAIGMPLNVVTLSGENRLEALGYSCLLVRPDQHIAWRGNSIPPDCRQILRKITGR